MRYLLLSSLLLFLAPSFAAKNTLSSCSKENLQILLIDETITKNGFKGFLEAFLTNERFRQKCEKDLRSFPEGRAYLEKGRQLKETYLSYYSKYFTKESDRLLLLTPDAEVLRRIYSLVDSGAKKSGWIVPKDWEIRQQALRDTATRFGLRDISENDFERKAKQDPSLDSAMHFFKRRQHVLRENMRTRAPIQDESPNAFKSRMIEIIQDLRVRNLKASVTEHHEISQAVVEFTVEKTNKLIKFKISDLLKMNLEFTSDRSKKGSEGVWSQLPQSLKLSYAGEFAKKKDHVKNYYEYFAATAQIPKGTLRFQSLTGDVFEISEADFIILLNTLSPSMKENYFGADPLRHRFLLETSARDAILSNMIAFLNEQRDSTAKDLYERLFNRIRSKKYDPSLELRSLTTHIATSGTLLLNENVQSDVLWNGLGQHADYWYVRNIQSLRMVVPYDMPENKIKEINREAMKAHNTEIKTQKWLNKLRTSPDSERSQAYIKKTSPFWVTAFALLGTYAYMDSALISDVKNFFSMLQLNTGPSTPNILMNDLEDGNVQFPEDYGKKEAKGTEKSCGHKFDATSSAYNIEVVCNLNKNPAPEFYSFASNPHFDELKDGTVKKRRTFELFSGHGNLKSDITVDYNLNIFAKGKILPIGQIQDYKIVGLEIYKYGKKVDPSTYRVLELSGNRQLFAEFNSRSWMQHSYQYRAYYRYEPYEDTADSKISQGIDFNALNLQRKILEASGFEALSKGLNLLKSNPEGRVNFTDIARSFATSSKYTYTSKTWSVDSSVPEPYRHFTRYLDPNGLLNYQCTGSNNLQIAFLQEALKNDPKMVGVSATPLAGYTGKEKGVLNTEMGHQITLVFDQKGGYLPIDATPAGNHGGSNVVKPELEPLVVEKEEKIVPPWKGKSVSIGSDKAILPERRRLEVPKELEGTGPLEETPEDTEELHVKLDAEELESEDIREIFAKLEELRSKVVASAQPLVRGYAFLKSTPFRQVPGLSYLPSSLWLIETKKSRLSVKELKKYFHITELKELDDIFVGEKEALDKVLEALDRGQDREIDAQLEFLTHDPLRSQLRDLSNYMALYPWGTLLEKANAIKQARAAQTRCENALKNN